MTLTNADIVDLMELRRRLHSRPELSGEERETARAVAAALAPTAPDHVLTGLGGTGVAAVFEGAEPGPTVMFRAELDALPIEELSDAPHRSAFPGKGHLCGHDGHMAILAGVARLLGRERPRRGRVVLMFQPAEENGAGAAAVIGDPAFEPIAPDWAFSLHNMPGIPLGEVALREGPANCASAGLRILLTGKTSHASVPERGVSPADTLARLIPALSALGPGGPLQPGFRLATVTHARMGEAAFGIAPGEAELWVTLRALTDADMEALTGEAIALVRREAGAAGLGIGTSLHDIFMACTNDPDATAHLARALDAEGIPHGPGVLPVRASEDFGRFGHRAKSAMFFLGAGERHAMLHNPDYDFPDDLIAPAVRIFDRVRRDLLG